MRVSVTADGRSATLSLLPESGVNGEIPLTLDQLSQLIASLGQARAAIVAKIPPVPIEGAPLTPVFGTSWAVQPEALTEGSVIAFQHPAYGPVGFVLPPADTEKVVRALTTHLGMVHSQDTDRQRPS